MPMKTRPGQHPRVEDFNKIYGNKHVHKLAAAHKRLGRRFKLGDHVEHVTGIADEDIRYWRVHMRTMPRLPRTLLREAIDHSLSATPPLPIRWVIKRRSAGGWSVAVTERQGKLVIEVVPPPLRAAPKSRRRAA